MHKVETAGHAGTESGLPTTCSEAADCEELPSVGLKGSTWRVGPRVEGGVQAVGCLAPRQRERCDGALWEVAPIGRNEQRIKADVARDWKCMPFLVIAACPQRCDADG